MNKLIVNNERVNAMIHGVTQKGGSVTLTPYPEGQILVEQRLRGDKKPTFLTLQANGELVPGAPSTEGDTDPQTEGEVNGKLIVSYLLNSLHPRGRRNGIVQNAVLAVAPLVINILDRESTDEPAVTNFESK